MLFTLIAFVALLVLGLKMGELTWRGVLLCVVIAMCGAFALVVFQWPVISYTVVLALLDIVLVLVVFKGDIVI